MGSAVDSTVSDHGSPRRTRTLPPNLYDGLIVGLVVGTAPERGDLCGPGGSAQGGTPGASGQWIAFNSDRNRYT